LAGLANISGLGRKALMKIHMPGIQINIKRNKLMLKLEEIGISTRQGTHAVHTLGYYKNKYNLKEKDYINAYAADRLTLALPLYVGMTEDDVNYIVEAIKKCVV
jgi:perosamine synthetase